MFVLAAVLLMAAVAETKWYGMTPSINEPQHVDIFTMTKNTSLNDLVARIELNHSQTEHVSIDSFRCKPYGTYCMFTSTDDTNSWWARLEYLHCHLMLQTAFSIQSLF